MKVVAAIIKRSGRVLLAQRKDRIQGWEFPGGKVEVDETPEQALIREIREELGVEVRILNYLATVSLPDNPKARLLAYAVKLQEDNLKLNSHLQFSWVKPEDLLNFKLLPADRKLVEKLITKNLLP